MTYVVDPDYDALPAAMLPTVKKHVRADDFTDDDVILTEYIAQAIGLMERFWDLTVFGSALTWTIDTSSGASKYQCPKQPVSAFTVKTDTVDKSSEYRLESYDLAAPVWLVHIDGTAIPANTVATLTIGYVATNKMPPEMRSAIYRVAGTLYEHRESVSTLRPEQMPFWLNDVLGGLWTPRA